MAGEDYQVLLKAGPFHKLDSKTAQVYTDPSSAITVSNADTARNVGSLMNCFGRNAFVQFPALGALSYVWRYDVSPTRPYWVVSDANGTLYYYDMHNDLISNITRSTGLSTQVVESNGNLFFNNGQQGFIVHDAGYPGSPQQTIQLAQWQYPAPDPAIYTYAVGKASATPGPTPGLAPATYTYAFAQVIFIPGINGDIKQTTAVTGGNTPYPYKVRILKSDVNIGIEITGVLGGTTAEGFQFKTAIYRMSSNVPVWYQVAIVSASVYVDDASDQSISGNPQMSFAGQQPPTTVAMPNPIASHQDRMWVMAVVNSTNTNNVPQTQVWYSNTGQPWNFDAVNAVLLLDDEQTLPIATGTSLLPYGEQPMAMVSLGSILMCFLSSSTWFINGSDETTYQPLQLFPDIGLIAPLGWCLGGGMVAWISAQGIWTYDGANLTYISQDIYNALQAIVPEDQTTCAATYADEQFFFSFPTAGKTFRFYLPTKEWTVLPYAAPSFAASTSVGSNPTPADSFKFNQIVAVRETTDWLDSWLDGKENDLGTGIAVQWRTSYSDAGAPQTQKDYRWLGISAPQQTGKVTLNLYVDYGNVPLATGTFDLSSGFTTQFVPIAQGSANGYVASLEVLFTTPEGATAPIEVWSAFVGGTAKRSWVIADKDG